MSTPLKARDWASTPRRALRPTEVVTRLATAPGWQLTGDGANVAIEKSFSFPDSYQTMAFVNAVAFIAHREDHHPELRVTYGSCTVRLNTHDVQGLSETDFECAAQIDALVATHG